MGESFTLVWGSPTYFEAQRRLHAVDNWLTRRLELNSYRLDGQHVDEMLDAIQRHRPVLISGYSTALYLIAVRALEQCAVFPGLRAVQPNAEPTTQAMREVMARGFGCEVFDKYGSRETNIVAHEEPGHIGLRIQTEHTYLEFINGTGRRCEPGEAGSLIATTLNNWSMPLIRYETGDIAAPLPWMPESSRPLGLPRMTPVDGRRHDILCTPDGWFLHPQLFSNLLREVPQIRWFQVVQAHEDHLTLRLVLDGDLNEDLRQMLTSRIGQLAGFEYRVSFELLDEVPPGQTGKAPLVVNTLARDPSRLALADLNELRRAGP